MAKRSNFERKPRDLYPTPEAAVAPLAKHLRKGTDFIEPCAGDGALIRHLEALGHNCITATDIEPQAEGIRQISAEDMFSDPLFGHWTMAEMIITNPPWKWELLQPILDAFIQSHRPAWVLLPADFAHNVRFSTFMDHCERIVSIGRVKWEPGSKHTGKENAAWYLINPTPVAATLFFGRAA